MQDPAQSSSRLMAKLKTSFSSGSRQLLQKGIGLKTVSQSSIAPKNTAAPQDSTVSPNLTVPQDPVVAPDPVASQKVISDSATSPVQLDVLDQVLTEVETEQLPISNSQDQTIAVATEPLAVSNSQDQAPEIQTPVLASASQLNPAEPQLANQVETQVESQLAPPLVTQVQGEAQTQIQVEPPSQLEPQSPVEPQSLAPTDSSVNTVAQGMVSQALPLAVANEAAPDEVKQAEIGLNPSSPRSTAKEALDRASAPDKVVDAPTGVAYVEQERTAELPPEVDGFLKEVEDHADQLPKEIVIADGSTDVKNSQHYPSQPVIVIPITPALEKQGKKKSPKFSVRWLVEWSIKIMKMFAGKVIYREVETKE